MEITKYSILLLCVIISLVLLCRADADSSEQRDLSIDDSEEDLGDKLDLYRRASLRPIMIHQRASLRPFAGKRASLRPVGKRASLRPPSIYGKRKRRSPTYFDDSD